MVVVRRSRLGSTRAMVLVCRRRWCQGLTAAVLGADRLTDVTGKRHTEHCKCKRERQQALSHLCPSISNPHCNPARSRRMSFVRRYDGRHEVLAMRWLGTYHVRIVWFLALLLFGLSACSPTSPSSEITRDRAIDLARQHISFEPTNIATETDSRQGRPVWVVTFRRADGSHGGLGQFVEVTLDRRTGQLVTIAMS